jgi:hypothetical protein
LKEDELDLLAEQMDKEAEDAKEKMLKDMRSGKDSEYSNTHVYNSSINVKESVFRNVSLTSLNNWLRNISTNEDVSELKRDIMKVSKKKEALYDAYLKSIEPLDDEIREYNQKIVDIKKNPVMNRDAKRISKIISQAIDQNPELAAMNAKAVLVNDSADVVVDINKIDELSDQEKDELYEQYLHEFKVLAGFYDL